jgi:dTMP kinase
MSMTLAPVERGKLVVLEGPDGVGKTTQCAMLAARWRREGRSVLQVKLPAPDIAGGAFLRDVLGGNAEHPGQRAMQALFAANHWTMAPRLLSWLAAGHWLVVDRWWLSSVVYGHHGDGLPIAWLRGLYDGFPVVPDALVVLELDPLECAARKGKTGDLYDADAALQGRVRGGYRHETMCLCAPRTGQPAWPATMLLGARGTDAQVHQRLLGALSDAAGIPQGGEP